MVFIQEDRVFLNKKKVFCPLSLIWSLIKKKFTLQKDWKEIFISNVANFRV